MHVDIYIYTYMYIHIYIYIHIHIHIHIYIYIFVPQPFTCVQPCPRARVAVFFLAMHASTYNKFCRMLSLQVMGPIEIIFDVSLACMKEDWRCLMFASVK